MCKGCPSVLRYYGVPDKNPSDNIKSDLVNEYAAMSVVCALMNTIVFALYLSHPIDESEGDAYQVLLQTSAILSILSWYYFAMSTFGYIIFIVFLSKMHNKKVMAAFDAKWSGMNFIMFNLATLFMLMSICIDSYLRYGTSVMAVAITMLLISLSSWFVLIRSIDQEFMAIPPKDAQQKELQTANAE